MRWFAPIALSLVLVGCSKDGDVMDPEIVSFEVNPTEITAGTDATVMIEVNHFEFTGHDEMTGMSTDAGDGHSHEDGHEGVQKGHVHIYLDDTETNPLVMMMADMDTFTMPIDTTAGAHTLIARLHDDGHLIIEPEVIAELEVTVLAP